MACPCDWRCGCNAPKKRAGDVAKVDLGEECGRREEGEAHVAEDVLRGARVEKAPVEKLYRESRVESE